MEIYQCNDWIKSVKETEQEFTPHQEETRLCVFVHVRWITYISYKVL